MRVALGKFGRQTAEIRPLAMFYPPIFLKINTIERGANVVGMSKPPSTLNH